jgi:hypothetical protein
MYAIISIFSSLKAYFTFTDCLFFGAIISATDPGKFLICIKIQNFLMIKFTKTIKCC